MVSTWPSVDDAVAVAAVVVVVAVVGCTRRSTSLGPLPASVSNDAASRPRLRPTALMMVWSLSLS